MADDPRHFGGQSERGLRRVASGPPRHHGLIPLRVPGVTEGESYVSHADDLDGRGDPNRRDFLYIATAAAGVVVAGAAVWPLVDQMNPSRDVLALASIEVPIDTVEPGTQLIVKWRGKPVFVRRRTPEEIKAAEDTPLDELKDPIARNENLPPDAPATDQNRALDKDGEWLVTLGVCTHLGCVPIVNAGEYNGWFCPCHGSVYDTAGRIRSGPAPENLHIPVTQFTSETTIKLG